MRALRATLTGPHHSRPGLGLPVRRQPVFLGAGATGRTLSRSRLARRDD